MCMYMYICIHTHTHLSIYHISLSLYIYIYICVCVYIYIYIYIYKCVPMKSNTKSTESGSHALSEPCLRSARYERGLVAFCIRKDHEGIL